MIIYGWGKQTHKHIGIVFKRACGNCGNEEYWKLTRTITWFTLYFVPLVPYSIKHLLSCPVCEYGFFLTSEQTAEVKTLVTVNQLMVNRKIHEEQYNSGIRVMNRCSELEVKNAEITEEEIPLKPISVIQYCGNCGMSLQRTLKFCGDCGVEVLSK